MEILINEVRKKKVIIPNGKHNGNLNLRRVYYVQKILALLTASCICLSIPMSASAAAVSSQDLLEENKVNQISTAIKFVEETKSVYGLDDVNFNNLELGSSIITYEYVDDSFKVLGEMIPIFSGDEIVASAFNVGDGTYSIETLLASDINNVGFDNIAIVYDRDEVYLFNGADFVLLEKSNTCISERDNIDTSTSKTKEHHIATTDLRDNTRIRLNNGGIQGRTTLSYVQCDVEYVTQNPYENLCWAASIAMIKNYKSGTSLTAADVSRRQFGTLQDQTLTGTLVQSCMRNKYGLNYSRRTALTENIIYYNLANDYPVMGVFSWTIGGESGLHDCVIFGDNPFSLGISLMDPMRGAVAASGSGGQYKYVSSVNGATLTLTAGYCYYWTTV